MSNAGTIKIVSNGDGTTGDRGATFAPRTANTYTIYRDGAAVGSIDLIPNYPLAKIDPAYAGRANVWVAYVDGAAVAANQRLAAVKAAVRKS